MGTEPPAAVPETVRRLLASGRIPEAGEALRGELERLARSSPGEAVRRARLLAGWRVPDGRLQGFVTWAAGAALHLAGESGEAGALLEDAARTLARHGETGAADRCRLLLIDVYGERQELTRARRLARRLAERFERSGDARRAGVALANLACAEDALDRVARAESLWREALPRFPEGDLGRLLVKGNLANVEALRGRFAEASRLHRAVEEAAEGRDLHGLALQARLNRAGCEFAAGALDEALELWHGVIREARGVGAEGLRIAAEVELARAELELGDVDAARRRAEAVVPEAEEAGLVRERIRAERVVAVAAAARGHHSAWRELYRRLKDRGQGTVGDLLLAEVGQLDPSIPSADLARAARRLARQGFLVRSSVALSWAARRALEQGRPRRAVALAREVLESGARSPWPRMVAAGVLGRASPPDRIAMLGRAVREARALHGRLRSPADRAAFVRQRGEVYGELVEALLETGRARDRRRALDLLAELRESWMADHLAGAGTEGDDPLVGRWRELRNRLASLLAELEGEDEPRLRASGLSVERELATLARETRAAEQALARSRPAFPLPGPRREVGRRLAAVLPEGDVFVEYHVGPRHVDALILSRGRLCSWRAYGAARRLRELLQSVRFHLDAASLADAGWSGARRQALPARLAELAGILLAPLRELEWTTLWLAPDDGLFHLPWTALPTGEGACLLDRGTVAVVPGAEAAAVLLESEPRPPEGAAVLGAAQPDLPWVGREIREMARLLPGALVHEDATRQDLIRALTAREMVHLAGHALFLDGLPWASGLRLRDGFVTAHDLAASRLRARVVSFGVCSGLRLGEEGERFGGFLRALVAGGARTMVGPVTAVEDETAYTFDVAWADGLRRTGRPGAAFREAVSAVRRLEDDPAVWGSFQLYGDPRGWGTT